MHMETSGTFVASRAVRHRKEVSDGNVHGNAKKRHKTLNIWVHQVSRFLEGTFLENKTEVALEI